MKRLWCRLAGHPAVKFQPAFRVAYGSFYGEEDTRNVLWHEWKHVRSCECERVTFIASGIPYVQ